jgi:hypothetical protein
MVLGVMTVMLGALADLIGRNRLLLEQTLERLRAIEDRMGDDNTRDSEKMVAPPSRRKRA